MFSILNTSRFLDLVLRTIWIYSLLLTALSPVVLVRSLCAQTNALPVEDAVMPAEIAPGSSLSFSRDSKYIAYIVTRGHLGSAQTVAEGVPWFARGADIHVINLITNTEENITAGEGSNWQPVWSPQRDSLAFLSDRGSTGKIHLWLWDVADNALTMPSSLVGKYGDIEWTQDGRGIVFSTSISSDAEGVPRKQNLQDASFSNVPGVRVYESATNSAERSTSNPWSLDDYSAELVSTDLSTGSSHPIFGGRIGTYKLSPDGSRLAMSVATGFEKPGSQQMLFDLVMVSLASGEREVVISGACFEPDGSGFSWSPDSRRLFVRFQHVTENIDSFKVVDLAKGNVLTLLEPTQPTSGHAGITSIWDKLSEFVYFAHSGELWRGDAVKGTAAAIGRIPGRTIVDLVALRNESALVVTHDDNGKQDGVYEVKLATGENRRLMENGHCYTCALSEDSLVTSPNGQRIAFVSEDSAHSPQLWMADPEFQNSQQLTHLNPQFESRSMGKASVIDWLSDDGNRLHGALLLPSNYRSGERVPLVVYTYGGVPLSDHFDRFGLAGSGPVNMQLLATRGYAVLLPDAPQRAGTPMLDLAKAILPGVNKCIELGIADPDRLAVMGHSYGGYTALSLIVQTGRFKAAISIAGGSDLFGFYGEMQDDASTFGVAIAEHGQGAMGGMPWERRDRYIENSPFFYFDRIGTPLLIIQGSSDTAVAPFLGDQIFVALRRLGKEAEYAKYEGEGHSPSQEWSYDHQVDLSYRVIRFLDSHLR